MAQFLKELLRNNENYVRAPDRNPLIAPQADLAKTVKNFLNQYETKKVGNIDSPWNRYGSGHSFGDLLFGQSPELLDDMSYGKNPLTSGGRTGRIPIPDQRLLDMPIPIPSTGGMGVIKKEGQKTEGAAKQTAAADCFKKQLRHTACSSRPDSKGSGLFSWWRPPGRIAPVPCWSARSRVASEGCPRNARWNTNW